MHRTLLHSAQPFAYAAVILLLASCGSTASATFTVRVELEVGADSLVTSKNIEEETPDGKFIKRISCEAEACAIDDVALVCVDGLCNPEAQTLSGTLGEVINVNQTVEGLDAFSFVDQVEIVSAKYQVTRNTLNLAAEPIELFWGPTNATNADESMGARPVASLPALSTEETSSGDLVIDTVGAGALTKHLSETDETFRFLYRTAVDLEPGQAYPKGTLAVAVSFEVKASGELL